MTVVGQDLRGDTVGVCWACAAPGRRGRQTRRAKKTVVIGRTVESIAAGAGKHVKVVLNRTRRRLLAAHRVLHATLTTASGGKKLSTHRVTIKQAKKKHHRPKKKHRRHKP